MRLKNPRVIYDSPTGWFISPKGQLVACAWHTVAHTPGSVPDLLCDEIDFRSQLNCRRVLFAGGSWMDIADFTDIVTFVYVENHSTAAI
jgi:hypothetical protein